MIEGTFYTEETTQFFTSLEEGHTYLISDAVIDVANKKFTSIRHDYRLIFKMHSTFTEVTSEPSTPSLQR